jgi:uncharacterized protein YgbK (DUF1537 family)
MDKLDHILIGCIADDFTGASDAASFLAKNGIKTLLFNGIPEDQEDVHDCAAIVIALKSRSIPANDAVAETLAAAEWLKSHQVDQLYLKYCSTFDSTPEGNIGPDIDAILDKYQIKYTVLCPALPVNRRIVDNGILIVDDKPIAEGHMAHHPLNPIWDSRISELMRPQGKYPCMIIGADLLAKTKSEILSAVEDFGKDKKHFYIIPNYVTDADWAKIAEVFGGIGLLTGGSGLLEHLSNVYKGRYDCTSGEELSAAVAGKGIALSGSCSTMTSRQCKSYGQKHETIAVYPAKLLSGEQTADTIWQTVNAEPEKEFLVYSAGATDPKSREYKDQETFNLASKALENTMAEVAHKAFDAGYTRIICAGGETSSAICLALDFDAFIIGPSIDPGVPVLTPLHQRNIRLALKSGNFGKEDFFEKALNMTRK